MHIHILRDEADYQRALADYEAFFDDEPAPGSEAGDRFELLGLVLAKYEEEHFRPSFRIRWRRSASPWSGKAWVNPTCRNCWGPGPAPQRC